MVGAGSMPVKRTIVPPNAGIREDGVSRFPMRRRIAFGCAAMALLALSAGVPAMDSTAGLPKKLVLGTYPSELPSEELEKIKPIRAGLEKRLLAAGYRVDIDIQIFQSYEEAIQGLVSGKADFARMGPVNYVLAKYQKPALRLLAMETQNASRLLTGYIFVPENSPVRTLKDLRGKTVAFGSPNSTTGRYYPQAALLDAGIFASDLAGFRYLQRHDKVFRAVGEGGFDAGASNEVTFKKYGVDRKFRIIHTMKSPAHAWVSRPELPVAAADLLVRALVDLSPAELEALSRDGVVAATDADFDRVRQVMKRAEHFIE